MAAPAGTAIPERTLTELSTLLWGRKINEDLFRRWNQGFLFSEDEPTALLQHDGGPCAVIVPVQAYVLKNLLFVKQEQEGWRHPSVELRNAVFCEALTDILMHSQLSDSVTIAFCSWVQDLKKEPSVEAATTTQATAEEAVLATSAAATTHATAALADSTKAAVAKPAADNLIASTSSPQSTDAVNILGNEITVKANQNMESETESVKSSASIGFASNAKRQRFGHEEFHSNLRLRVYRGRAEVLEAIKSLLDTFYGDCGVLILLYSVLLTRGVEQIKHDVADLDEPLIDSVHGHGSQSLINLLLTGKAASHVWDNEKDVSGLKLQGISSKSEIGFLTLLEHLRYCEVGWYLKNPVYPIWLLGSETHLTVLFSLDRTLVGEETAVDKARRLFSQFDQEGRGFITVDSLGDLMSQLDLVAVPEYVKIMADKLDPEQLGVITLNGFLEEFFATGGAGAEDGHRFCVYHYNGLPQSFQDSKVIYRQASCLVMDMPELQMISDYSPIKTCLLTKWPTIEVTWRDNIVPSMN